MIVKLPPGNWRAQVRCKGKYVSNTFWQRADGDTWALETERTIDKGIDPKAVNPRSVTTFGEIIDLQIQDMLEVRTKSVVPKVRFLNHCSSPSSDVVFKTAFFWLNSLWRTGATIISLIGETCFTQAIQNRTLRMIIAVAKTSKMPDSVAEAG